MASTPATRATALFIPEAALCIHVHGPLKHPSVLTDRRDVLLQLLIDVPEALVRLHIFGLKFNQLSIKRCGLRGLAVTAKSTVGFSFAGSVPNCLVVRGYGLLPPLQPIAAIEQLHHVGAGANDQPRAGVRGFELQSLLKMQN